MTVGGVCFAASAAGSITTSEQTFQIAGGPVTVAGHVLAAKLPLPANSKIVTLNVPSTQGGREHDCPPFWQICELHLPKWIRNLSSGRRAVSLSTLSMVMIVPSLVSTDGNLHADF